MLTVGQLVEIEHLGLSVEAGAAGLDQQITWAHVCELDDPRRWLDGGELIMTTGLAVPRQAAAQAGYVDRLCEAGAAALGIAAGMSSPPLTATMRRRADAAGFPVLRVSYEVPFLAISQVVQAANSESYERSLLGSLTIFDSLRRGTTVFASAAEVLTRLEVVSGYALGLASADRALIFGDRGLLDIVPEVVSGGDERPVVEVAVRDGRRRYALPLSIAGRFSGFLLAEERHPGTGLGALALQNVATVAAVQLAAIRRSRDLHFRIARETFDDVFSGVLAEETIKRRVELAGLDGDADLVLLCLEGVAGREGDRGTAVRDLYGALCDAGVLTLVRSDDAIVWIAMAADDYRRLGVEDRLAALVPTTAHVGVSRAIDRSSDVRRAASEARWAMAEGCRRDVPVVDASFASDPALDLSWLPKDPFLLEDIVKRTLGPLVSGERAGERAGAELLRSLEAYLEEGQRIDATCQRLDVHRHTLAYRLRKVEELTGRSLHRIDDVVELWRAVRARSVLEPFAGD